MKSRDRTVFFSERNGYVLPPDKYVLEDVPPIVLNAICSAFLVFSFVCTFFILFSLVLLIKLIISFVKA